MHDITYQIQRLLHAITQQDPGPDGPSRSLRLAPTIFGRQSKSGGPMSWKVSEELRYRPLPDSPHLSVDVAADTDFQK